MKIQGHGQEKILSSEEIARLFAAFRSERDRALFACCFFTGCRINEAQRDRQLPTAGFPPESAGLTCTLLSSDVFDLLGVRAKITIRKANTKGKQETRQIPTSSQLQTCLEAYRDQVGK